PASGIDPARTVIGAPGFDPARTAMGAPGGLTLQVVPGNRYALATEASREHALLQLQSSGMMAGRRLPLNLCLVIDRSGSMEGEPLDYVKRACGHVVDLLEPTDVLSVVTFEEQVDVVMPARRVVNKQLIKEHIKRIGGNYYYISRPELIPEVFRKELDALLTVTAKNLRLRLLLSRWVQVRQIYGHLPTFGNRTVEVPLPDLERGMSLSPVVELELGRRPPGSYRVARVEVLYDDAVTGAMGQTLADDLVFEFVTDRSLVASG